MVEAYWDAYIPDGRATGSGDDDRVREAVMEALPEQVEVHLWGRYEPGVIIALRCDWQQVEVMDDYREDGDG